jgi:hypothetical protein
VLCLTNRNLTNGGHTVTVTVETAILSHFYIMPKTKTYIKLMSSATGSTLTALGDLIIYPLAWILSPLTKRAEALEQEEAKAKLIERHEAEKDDYFTRSESGFKNWLENNQKSYTYHHSTTQKRVGGKFAKQS